MLVGLLLIDSKKLIVLKRNVSLFTRGEVKPEITTIFNCGKNTLSSLLFFLKRMISIQFQSSMISNLDLKFELKIFYLSIIVFFHFFVKLIDFL